MSGIRDTATVTLNVNGKQAKQMMSDLETKIKSTEAAITKLKASGTDPKAVQKAQKQLQSYQKQLDEMRSATEGVSKAMSNLDRATPRQLEKALRTLNRQLKDMTPGSMTWQSHIDKIRQLQAQLKQLKLQVQGQETIWQRFSKWWYNSGQAVAAIIGGYQLAISKLRSFVNDFAEMEEQLADTRKFTGMTETQVRELNEEFKNMDTRTSREQLNLLAQEAGRLGKTTEESVQGYVEAADIINVALVDLGQGATQEIAKLSSIFNVEDAYGTKDAMLKVGSTVNVLSQNCTASKPYIVEFTKRLAGVGSQARMTVPEIMAFAATLDANGQAVEMSASALSRTIMMLFQKPKEIAKTVGLDVDNFTKTLQRNTTEGLMMFFGALQKMGNEDALAALSPMFKDLGMDGVLMSTVLATVANKLDMVKWEMDEANKAFREGTSATREYNIFNNTAQASLDKAKKKLHEISVELGERLYPLMAHLMTSGSAVMRALLSTIRFMDENKREIIVLASAIAGYTVAVKAATAATHLMTVAQKAVAVASSAWRVSVLAVNLLVGKFTGNVIRAGKAQLALNAAMKANPIGLVIGGLTAVVTAMYQYQEKTRAAREELERTRKEQLEFRKNLTDLTEETSRCSQSELARVKVLYDTATSERKSRKEREEAARTLISTYPELFRNMSIEAVMVGEAKTAYDSLTSSILENAKARAAGRKYNENASRIVDIETEIHGKESERWDIVNERRVLQEELDAIASVSGATSDRAKELIRSIDEKNSALRELNDSIQGLYDRRTEVEDANSLLLNEYDLVSATSSPAPLNVESPQPHGYESQKDAEKERRKQEAEARRAVAKAKAEFKAALNIIKAQRTAADAEILDLYRKGSIDYEELIEHRHENELKYFDDSIEHFRKTFADQKDSYLDEDKDYQKLLLNREKADEKYEKNRVALAIQTINRRKAAEERDAQHMYDVKSGPTLADEIALQARLYGIRRQALEEQQALYTEGSKEWADIAYQIADMENEKEINLKKIYFKTVSCMRSKYEKKSAIEQFRQEKATLDSVLAAKLISEDEYNCMLASLRQQQLGSNPADAYSSDLKAMTEVYQAQLALAGDDAEKRLQIERDFQERKRTLQQQYAEAGVQDTRNSFERAVAAGAEWLNSDGGKALTGTMDVLASGLSSVFSGLSTMIQAELQIQTAAIEKRYDKEIQKAQGNSYLVAKLEKKKEKEIAKAKNEANKKMFAMQVIQAVAQTAQNAISAYGSAIQIPIVGLTLAPIAAAMAVAAGAIQIAAIKKQQQASESQGYSQGGFTKKGAVDEPAGIVHAGEWVASQKLLANPVARPMIEALDYAQRTNTLGSLKSEDVSRAITAPVAIAQMTENSPSSAILAAAVMQTSSVVKELTDRLKEPFVTVNTVIGDYGIKKAQDEYTRLMNNVTPKSKRR